MVVLAQVVGHVRVLRALADRKDRGGRGRDCAVELRKPREGTARARARTADEPRNQGPASDPYPSLQPRSTSLSGSERVPPWGKARREAATQACIIGCSARRVAPCHRVNSACPLTSGLQNVSIVPTPTLAPDSPRSALTTFDSDLLYSTTHDAVGDRSPRPDL